MLSSLAGYSYLLWFHVKGSDMNVAYGMIVWFFVAGLPVMIRWKWRARSGDQDEFYGGGLSQARGRLWCLLGRALWISFILGVIHLVFFLDVPLPQRKSSVLGAKLMSVITFYFSTVILFGSLYGIRAFTLYRFVWEHFYGKRSGGQRGGVR